MLGLPFVYFQPNQLVLLATQPGSVPLRSSQIESLIGWINKQAQDILPTQKPIIRIDQKSQLAPFLVTNPEGKMPGPKASQVPGDVRPKVSHRGSFTVLFPNVDNLTLLDLVRLAQGLDGQKHQLDDQGLQKELGLVGVSLAKVDLNWLVAAGQSGGLGSGGPGGEPAPYTRAAGATQDPYRFDLPKALTDLMPDDQSRGQGVGVVILDTAPDLQSLANAYYHWGGPGGHPLVKDLLRSVNQPGDLLSIEYASHLTLSRLAPYRLPNHDYDMSDHGTFVAGIVHSLAPQAELHLLEVLNPFGLCDGQSVADGLRRAAEIVTGQIDSKVSKWVINCSLFVIAPADEAQLDQALALVTGLPGDADLQTIFSDPTLRKWLMDKPGLAIEYICDYLYADLGTKVVAAAGNDGPFKEKRFGPRYPARSPSVEGVAALPKGTPAIGGMHQTASYSNQDDDPTDAGLATLGGEKGSGNGVLGMYIGLIPHVGAAGSAGPSQNGWAWWSGTSFATPIITGVTAAVLNGPKNPATTQDAIEAVYTATGGRMTGVGEPVLVVNQV